MNYMHITSYTNDNPPKVNVRYSPYVDLFFTRKETSGISTDTFQLVNAKIMFTLEEYGINQYTLIPDYTLIKAHLHFILQEVFVKNYHFLDDHHTFFHDDEKGLKFRVPQTFKVYIDDPSGRIKKMYNTMK